MTSMITALMGFFILSTVSLGHVAAAGSLNGLPGYQVTLTGYNAVPEQTDSDPSHTASGAYSNPNVVAARSDDLASELPFGTVIAIEPSDTSSPDCGYPAVADRIGFRVIADSMNPRFTKRIDVLFGNHDTVSLGGKETNAARALGVCNDVKIAVVGHISISNMPTTQDKLAAMMTSGSPALAVNK